MQHIFISYSREDSAFVDRLQADLSARGFPTWVDRSRMEAGDKWREAIEKAIRDCQAFVLVLSPSAVASEPVRDEVVYAKRFNKFIVPVLHKPCPPLPMGWDIHWVAMDKNYNVGLDELLLALMRRQLRIQSEGAGSGLGARLGRLPGSLRQPPSTAPEKPSSQEVPETDLRTLYSEALNALAENDLERADIYLREVLRRDPNYPGAKQRLDTLSPQLRLQRISHLTQEAVDARAKGDWAKERGAWRKLLELDRQNKKAQDRIPICERNLKYADKYFVVLEQVERGHLDMAREELSALWKLAPFYEDPGHVAGKLRLTVPDNPEEIERKHKQAAQEAENARIKKAQDAARERAEKDARLKREKEDAERDRKKAEEERQRELRTIPGFVKLALHYSPFVVWLCVYALLAGVGCLATLVTHSWLIGLLVVPLLAMLAHFTGYRRAIHFPTMAGIAVLAGASAYAAVWLFQVFPNPALTVFNVPLFGTLRVGPDHQWIFALVFALLLLVPGALIGGIDDGIGGLILGGVVGLAFGGALGLAIAYWGWLVSGLILGALVGMGATGASDAEGDDGKAIFYASMFGGIPSIALLMWLLCAKLFEINSIAIVWWTIGLTIGAIAGAGVVRWFVVRKKEKANPM